MGGSPSPTYPPSPPTSPPQSPTTASSNILAFKEAIKPKVARVALLYWLAMWPAQQTGSRVACPPISCVTDPATPHVKISAPCPLSAQRWYTELNHRKKDGSLRTSTISLAVAGAARRVHPPANDAPAAPGAPGPAPAPPSAPQLPAQLSPQQPPAQSPPEWEALFQAGSTPSSQDTLSLLDSLSAVTEVDAHYTAMCVVAMGKSCHLPPRAVQHLSVFTATARLVLAAQGAWHSCPGLHISPLCLHLNKLFTLVSQRYGAAATSAAPLPALQAI